MKTERKNYFDIAKGIGIICVVLGHIWPNQQIRNVIYSFHMPLFFFISGCLFKPNYNQKLFVKNKTKQLIIPYLFYLSIIYTFQLWYQYHGHLVTTSDLPKLLAYPILGGRWLSGFTTAFWYIPVLFFVLILSNYLILTFQRRISLIIISTVTLSYLYSYHFSNIKLPLNVDVVLGALPYTLTGFKIKTAEELDKNKIGFFLLSTLSIVLVWKGLIESMDMKNSRYGSPILSYLVALSISASIIIISLSFEKTNALNTILAAIGKASLVIMYLHQSVQIIVNTYFNTNIYFRVSLSITVPLIIYLVLKRNTLTRTLFLGDVNRSFTKNQ